MKGFIKKTFSVILIVLLLFSVIPLGENGLSFHAKAGFLTDEQIARYVNLFGTAGNAEAEAAYAILSGEREGTVEELKAICKNIGMFFGVFADTDLDNDVVKALSNSSIVTNAITGIFDIIDNIESIQNSQSSLQEAVDGMQIGISFFQIINLGSYIPSGLSLALTAIDISINIAAYLETKYFEEYASLYEAELQIEYYTGQTLTYKTAPSVSGFGLTQEEADTLYSSIYLKYFGKQCVDRLGSNSGSGEDSEEKEVKYVDFPKSSHTMFFNYTFTNTAVAYPTDATDRSITYTSSNTSVATVNSSGTITPVSYGTVTIKASTSNGVYDTCTVKILPFKATNENGEYTITEYIGEETTVEIPDAVYGVPVTKIGDYAFEECDAIENISISDNVTVIGYRAFTECTSLKAITIGENITNIENLAFADCSALTELYYYSKSCPLNADMGFSRCSSLVSVFLGEHASFDNSRPFDGCTDLTNITVDEKNGKYSNDEYGVLFNKDKTELIRYPAGNLRNSYNIPNSVTKIQSKAFYFADSLVNITLSENLASIEKSAFYWCTSLLEITIPKNVTYIGEYAFAFCSNLSSVNFYANDCSYMGKDLIGAFENCPSLTTVNIGENVKTIPSFAFVNCNALKNLSMGNSIEVLGDYSFSCTGLTNLEIPNSVKNIGNYAFSYSTIEKITLPKSVEQVGDYAFSGTQITEVFITSETTQMGEGVFSYCENLTEITIDNGVTTIGNRTFTGCSNLKNVKLPESIQVINIGAFEGCMSLETIDVPDSVSTIEECAFFRCNSLKKVEIGKGATNIGFGAFAQCENLTSVVIDNGKTSLDAAAFMQCTNLESVYLGDSVISIGENAFYGCTKLKKIEIPNSVINISDSAFEYCGITIYCFTNSYAHEFAESNDTPYILIDQISTYGENTTNVDFENKTINGILGEWDSVGSILSAPDYYELVFESKTSRIATGSKINIVGADGEITATYTMLVFGDVNGDGWYDGEDAVIVNLIAKGLLDEDDVGTAIWAAADCNHDGVIDESDVDLLTGAGLLLNEVDQSATAAELETNAAYIEYMGLIDQSFGMNVDNSTAQPENETASTENTTVGNGLDRSETDNDSTAPEFNFEAIIADIFTVIKNILLFIFSIIV